MVLRCVSGNAHAVLDQTEFQKQHVGPARWFDSAKEDSRFTFKDGTEMKVQIPCGEYASREYFANGCFSVTGNGPLVSQCASLLWECAPVNENGQDNSQCSRLCILDEHPGDTARKGLKDDDAQESKYQLISSCHTDRSVHPFIATGIPPMTTTRRV